jgi:hypothetical protein
MEQIRSTVENLLTEWQKRASGEGDPEQWLKKTLTKKELAHIKFNYFKKGVLGLSVDSSSLLYQLSLKKPELVKALQKEEAGIKDIRLRIGAIDGKK